MSTEFVVAFSACGRLSPARHALSLLLLIAGLCITPVALAVDLYSAEAPVAGESSEQRGAAIRSAFGRVLVKLTGRRDAAALHPALLDQGEGLVQEYRYRLAPAVGEDPLATPDRRLWVRFDPTAVDQLLASQQVSAWRRPRPVLLLWLGMEQNGRRELTNLELDPAELALVRQRAEARGLVVQLPLLDLQDKTQLTPDALWLADELAIRAASQRYQGATALVGQLARLNSDRWQARWTLFERDQRVAADGTPGSLGAVLAEGLDLGVDQLVAQTVPAVGEDASQRIRLQFVGVRSLADYAELIALMGRQQSISRLAMRQADADQLAIDVWLRGDLRGLQDALSADGRLYQALGDTTARTYDQAGNPIDEAPADLVYRWSP